MKAVLCLGLVFISCMVDAGETGSGFDWYKMPYYKMGANAYYVGNSVDAESPTQAVEAAEQEAIRGMIRHFFGVKIEYSLHASESFKHVSMSLTSAEISDKLNLTGLMRTNSKVVSNSLRRYSAWVQISIPQRELLSAKARLEEPQKATEISKSGATTELEDVRRVPKIFFGMSRIDFFKFYPVPNDAVVLSTDFAVFNYSPEWSFCDHRYLPCSFTFVDGRLSAWSRVKSEFIKISGS